MSKVPPSDPLPPRRLPAPDEHEQDSVELAIAEKAVDATIEEKKVPLEEPDQTSKTSTLGPAPEAADAESMPLTDRLFASALFTCWLGRCVLMSSNEISKHPLVASALFT